MADLQFWLLGSFQVWRGETRLDSSLPGQVSRALLARLLLEHDRFVPAERLIEACWPHLDPPAAANNLQVTVRKLRHWLEPGLPRGRGSRYLLTENGGYRFLAGDSRLDVDEFALAAQRGLAALRSDDLPGARAALERARQLYRGELLGELPYAEWVFPNRERLRESHLQALESLADVYLALGLSAEAAEVCRQALAVDPLREALTRQLMRSLAALGQRAEALALYADVQRLLSAELGVATAPETDRLRDAILAGALSPDEPARPPSPAPSIELPLVGRDTVLARLRAAVMGGQRLVLLSGEAGLGKSRLLAEFAAAAPAHRVYWSRARGGAPPLAAALGFFEDFLRRVPSARRLASLGPFGPALAQRVPLLRQAWPDCPAYIALPDEAEQQRLHQAVLAALRLAQAGDEPVVFVLDDLHWADEGSLAVLADWLRQPAARATLLCAFRAEEVPTGSALAGWLAEWRGAPDPPLDVELDPLEAGEVLAAVRAVAGLPDPLPLSQRLHAATAGHPLFLTESLRGLLESGQLRRPDGTWPADGETGIAGLPLTATLREAVLARTARLEPLEREALEAAAVLRPRLAAASLAAVLGTGAARLEAALQNLAARRLLLPSAAGEWEFSHYLLGEVIYADLAPSHLRLLHRLAANALMAGAPAEPGLAAAEIVRHLLHGTGEAGALARWALAAGKWALAQFDHRQAYGHFQLAETQLPDLPEQDRQTGLALALYEHLGRAQSLLGHAKDALQSLARALDRASDPVDRVRLLLLYAGVCERDRAEYDHATALLAEAEQLAVSAGLDAPGLMGELHSVQANIHYWRGEYQPGERLARQAIAETQGTPHELRPLQVLANILQKLGQLDEALELNQRMIALCEAAGDLRRLSTTYVNLGNGLMAVGRMAEAEAAHDQAIQLITQLGDRRSLSIAYVNAGIRARQMGDLARAEAELRRACDLAEQLGAPYTLAVAAQALGATLALRGRWEAAEQAFEQSLALAASIAARVVEAQAHQQYGYYVCWGRRDLAGARAHARAALEIGAPLDDNYCQREGRLLLAEVLLAEGEVAAAERAAREALQIAGAAQQVRSTGRAERVLAQAAAAREAFDEAARRLDASEAILRRAAAQIDLGETLLARAEITRAAGAAAAAWRPPLLEARRLFRRARARPHLKRAETLLAQI